MSFDRVTNRVKFTPSGNYLNCLRSSMMEQIVLYDVGTRRAWLVPLLSVFHHMLLVYVGSIEGDSRGIEAPSASSTSDGVLASFRALEYQGGVVVQGSGEDKLNIRDLIMGFSINLAKVSLQAPKRSKVYGYEFMDIVMDSPRNDLKKSKSKGKV